MNIFIIVSTVLFAAFIIGFIIFSKKTSSASKKTLNDFSFSCLTDVDCKPGEKCIYNPEVKKNVCISASKKYCDLSKGDLVPCDPNGDGSECKVCINGTKFGPNGLEFSCVTLDDTNRKLYKSVIPGIMGMSGMSGLPDKPPLTGSFCLPKMEEGEYCNIYTSDTILTRNIDGSYKWRCLCKNENRMFETDPTSGDCTVLTGCNNGKYPLYVRKPADDSGTTFTECTSNDICGSGNVCWDIYGNDYGDLPNEKGYCYTKWIPGIPNNPLTNGICRCEPGKYPYKTGDAAKNTILECLADTCQKNIKGDIIGKTIITRNNPTEVRCKCNAGYISCPEDIPDFTACVPGITTDNCLSSEVVNKRSLCKDIPQCIPDPCVNKLCSNNQSCASDENCNTDVNYSRCISGKCTSTSCQEDKDCGTSKICISNTSQFKKDKGCVCDQGFNVEKNNYSSVGQYCVDLCANNPCDNRGTCWVDFTDPKKPIQKCKNCQQPYTNCGEDKTKQCKNVLLPGGSFADDVQQCWTKKLTKPSFVLDGYNFTVCDKIGTTPNCD